MLVAFSVSPLGGSDSVSGLVAEAVRVVRESGLPNRTDSMFTTIEGEWDEVMDVVKRACEAAREGRGRGSLALKAEIRRAGVNAMTTKVEKVEQLMSEQD